MLALITVLQSVNTIGLVNEKQDEDQLSKE